MSALFVALVVASVPAEARGLTLNFGARVESFYSYSFNEPSNGVNNYRIIDNRHNSFGLSAVAAHLQADFHGAHARVALWVGHTPSTIYAGEPTADDSLGPSDASVWRLLEEAYAGYRFDMGLTIQGGLFLGPIGLESVRAHENWNWSSSILNFGFPFYHTGLRANLDVLLEVARNLAELALD